MPAALQVKVSLLPRLFLSSPASWALGPLCRCAHWADSCLWITLLSRSLQPVLSLASLKPEPPSQLIVQPPSFMEPCLTLILVSSPLWGGPLASCHRNTAELQVCNTSKATERPSTEGGWCKSPEAQHCTVPMPIPAQSCSVWKWKTQ